MIFCRLLKLFLNTEIPQESSRSIWVIFSRSHINFSHEKSIFCTFWAIYRIEPSPNRSICVFVPGHSLVPVESNWWKIEEIHRKSKNIKSDKAFLNPFLKWMATKMLSFVTEIILNYSKVWYVFKFRTCVYVSLQIILIIYCFDFVFNLFIWCRSYMMQMWCKCDLNYIWYHSKRGTFGK